MLVSTLFLEVLIMRASQVSAARSILVVALLTTAALAAETITWSRGMDLPLPRGGYSSAWYHGGLVLAGGTYWKDGKKYWSDKVSFYDLAQARWKEWKPLPLQLAYGSMAAVEGELYLLGGSDGTNLSREILHLQGEEWVRAGEMPSALVYAAAVSLGSRIYLIGGGSSVADLWEATAASWTYDVKTRVWKQLDPIPGPPRTLHAAAVLNKAIYVFGGATQEEGKELRNLDEAWKFDPATGKWRMLKRMPAPIRASWAIAAEGAIYLIGGYSDHMMDDVYRYDPADDEYSLVSHMPQVLCDAEFHYHDGIFYGAGGEDRGGSRFSGTLLGRWMK